MHRTSYIYNNSVYAAVEHLRACDSAEVYLENESGKKWVVALPTGSCISYNPQDTASFCTMLSRAFLYVVYYFVSPHFRVSSEKAFARLENAGAKVRASASKAEDVALAKLSPRSSAAAQEETSKQAAEATERKALLDHLHRLAQSHSAEGWRLIPEVIEAASMIPASDRTDASLSNVFKVLVFHDSPARIIRSLKRADSSHVKDVLECLCSLDPANPFGVSIVCDHLVTTPIEVCKGIMTIIPHILALDGIDHEQLQQLLETWVKLIGTIVPEEHTDCTNASFDNHSITYDQDQTLGFGRVERVMMTTCLLPPDIEPSSILSGSDWEGGSLVDFFRVAMRQDTDSRAKIIQYWSDVLESKTRDIRTSFICQFISQYHDLLGIDISSPFYQEVLSTLEAASVRPVEAPLEEGALWYSPFFRCTDHLALRCIFNGLTGIPQEERAELIAGVLPYLQFIRKEEDFALVIRTLKKIPKLQRSEVLLSIKPHFPIIKKTSVLMLLMSAVVNFPAIIPRLQAQKGINTKRFLKLLASWDCLVFSLHLASKMGVEYLLNGEEVDPTDIELGVCCDHSDFLNSDELGEIAEITLLMPPDIMPTEIAAGAEWDGSLIDYFRIVMKEGSASRQGIIQYWSKTLKSPDKEIAKIICQFMALFYHSLGIDPVSQLYQKWVSSATLLAAENANLSSFKKEILEDMPLEEGAKLWTAVGPFLYAIEGQEALDCISLELKGKPHEERADLLTNIVLYLHCIDNNEELASVIRELQLIHRKERAEVYSLIKPYFPIINQDTSALTFFIRMLSNIAQGDRTYVFQRAFPYISNFYQFLVSEQRIDKDSLCEKVIEFAPFALSALALAPNGERDAVIARVEQFLAERKTANEDSSSGASNETNDDDSPERVIEKLVLWPPLVRWLGYVPKRDWDNFLLTIKPSRYSDINTLVGITTLLPPQLWPKTSQTLPEWTWSIVEFFTTTMKYDAVLREEITQGWLEILKSDGSNAIPICEFIFENHEALDIDPSSPLYKEMLSAVSRILRPQVLEVIPLEESIRVFYLLRGSKTLELASSISQYLPKKEQADLLEKIATHFSFIKDGVLIINFVKLLVEKSPEDRDDIILKAIPYIKQLHESIMRFNGMEGFNPNEAKQSIRNCASNLMRSIANVPKEERADVLSKVDQYLNSDSDGEESDEFETETQVVSKINQSIKHVATWTKLVKCTSKIPPTSRKEFLQIVGLYLKSAFFDRYASMAELLPLQTLKSAIKTFNQLIRDEVIVYSSYPLGFFKAIMEQDPELWDMIKTGWNAMMKTEKIPQTELMRKFIDDNHKELGLLMEDGALN